MRHPIPVRALIGLTRRLVWARIGAREAFVPPRRSMPRRAPTCIALSSSSTEASLAAPHELRASATP